MAPPGMHGERDPSGPGAAGSIQPGAASSSIRPPVIGAGQTMSTITDKISAIVLSGRTPRRWWLALALTSLFVALMLSSIVWLLLRGVGIWGINVPVAWGFAIINFV